MTESTFTDHVQHATDLKNVIAGLTPAYAPGAPAAGELDLRIPAFESAIITAANSHQAVEDAAAAYGLKSTDREDCLKAVLAAGTSVLAFLRSKKKTLAGLLRGAERLVNKMRGPKAKKAPPPAEGEPPPPEKARNRGQQSYREQAGHLKTLHSLLNGIPAYAPGATHPAHPDQLEALLVTLEDCNNEISELSAAVIRTESEREDAFTKKDTGLHDHFLAMKNAVQSQYGATSTQFADVDGILW